MKLNGKSRMRSNRLVWVVACIAMLSAAGAGARSGDGFQVAIQRRIGLECTDCDGVALGDINGNGRVDLLASNGKGGTVFWFEQGDTPWDWTRHTIFAIPDRPGEIEGNDLGDFNGDGRLEAISLDQPNGAIYLHKARGDPRGPWDTVRLLTGRPYLQASLVADVDGDGRDDLIYTWEGDAPGRGGVHWLKLTGPDPLDPDHWTDHVMVTHEGAWWVAPGRADLSGNGRATDVVFTARNMPGRNPGTRPGLFWLEPPQDVTAPWTLRTIDRTLGHPLQVDWGNFSGDGHGRDLVVAGRGTEVLIWYEFSADWRRHDIPLPQIAPGVQANHLWNVTALHYGGPRDGILTPANRGDRGALLLFEWIDGRYRPNALLPIDYGHPMDDRMVLYDLDGNGRLEAIVPDSGPQVNRLWILQFAIRTETP